MCVGIGPRPRRVCRQWGFQVQALVFFGLRQTGNIGVFECRHWCFSGRGNGGFRVQALGFFVVTALVFLWDAASGLAELSAQAPVVFSGKKPGAAQKNGGKKVDSPPQNVGAEGALGAVHRCTQYSVVLGRKNGNRPLCPLCSVSV